MITAALSLRDHRPTNSGGTACHQLYVEYPSLLSLPNSTIYEKERIEHWDKAAILSPLCIFTPKTHQDITKALSILVQTQTPFAVRSGGHTPIPGASSTNDGVLIASDKLKTIELGTVGASPVAKVGTGLRWIEVYEWLAARSLTVIGGRYATVGVGGLSLGGGLNYYSSVHGWAADNILNYELVTAHGEVLQVNADTHPDLFWALKGGYGNFGFITRFDLAIFPLVDIYGGNFLTDASGIDSLLKAIAAFTDTANGGIADPLAAVNPTVQFAIDTRKLSSFTNVFYNSSTGSAPAAVKQFTEVPTIGQSTVAGPRSLVGFMNETGFSTNDMRRLFRAISVRCSPQAVDLVQQIFIEESTRLRNITGGTVTVTYQYLSQSFVDAAHTAGDAIDLDPSNGALIAITVGSSWELSSDDAYLLDFLTSLVEIMESKTRAAGLYYPFIFLNDAGHGQRPFELYGRGTSLPRMRQIAKQYDPSGVFQSLAAGAFKLQ